MTTTRRQWRKQRPVLVTGEIALEGTVARFNQEKGFGFIKPANGAANIHFSIHNVPHDRMQCVGVGRTVFFDVLTGSPRIRGKQKHETVTAKIRSRRP